MKFLFLNIAVLAISAQSAAPLLVTSETRLDKESLFELQKPGRIFFEDSFESEASLKKYFEIRGRKEGYVKRTSDPANVHSGKGALQITAPHKKGKSSGKAN